MDGTFCDELCNGAEAGAEDWEGLSDALSNKSLNDIFLP